MLDIQLLRKDLDSVVARLLTRKNPQVFLNVEVFKALESERKSIQTRTEELQSKRNQLSKQIGMLMGKGEKDAAEAAKAAADGYTLLFTTSSTHAISPHLMPKLAYKADKDFSPIVHTADAASVLLITPSLPVKSVQELIAYAKAHPGKLNYATSGNGTIVHLNTAAFAAQAGIQLTHVPYKGTGQSITDLAAGQVHLLFDAIPTGMPHVASGRLRALAVTGDKRSTLAPNLPTVAESGLPGYSSVTWFGVYGPAGMKPELVGKINQAFNQALQNPEVIASLAKQGVEPAKAQTPAQFAAMVQADSARWAKVIKDNRITLE
ncbi:MAG: tripartite tricarboxylate transporter substrate-binding protein [Comamonas sp.]